MRDSLIRCGRAQALPGAVAHGYQHQRDREAGGECRGLQRHEPAAEQQGDGHDPFERAPEDALGDRRIELSAGGDGVDDQRAGIGRGNEEDDHQHDADDRRQAGERQHLQHPEQGHFRLLRLHRRDLARLEMVR